MVARSSEMMDKALANIKPSDLPAPRQESIQLMRACSQEDVNTQQLADLVSTDPIMTAELLRIVNSPFFGMSGEVSNVLRAITILGHRAFLNMVLCISVKDALKPDYLPGLDIVEFWEDSLRRATAGKLLAPLRKLNADECFTACLLQDFGLLVLFHVFRDSDKNWAEFNDLDPDQRYELEQQVFKITHDQVSGLLAEQWSLPAHISDALMSHHSVDLGPSDSALADVMHCADWLAALFSVTGKSATLQTVHSRLSAKLKMDEEQVLETLQQIPASVEEAGKALGLHLNEQPDFEEVLRDTNMRLAEENTSYQELTWQLEQAVKERDKMAAMLVEEMELAAEIQRSLLPKEKDSVFPVYGVNVPVQELSGDFFDYFMLEDGTIHFNLGDVSGKGVTASLLMAKASSLFHCLAKNISDTGQLMKQINTEICETTVRGMFVAMVAGRYNPRTGQVQIVNAGSPPLLFFKQDETVEEIGANAPPLGIVPEAEFPVLEFMLGKGHMMMFSDGVTEGYIAKNEVLGMNGLLDIINKVRNRQPREQVDVLLRRFTGAGVAQRDDITIMVLEHCGQGFKQLCEYEFTSKPVELQAMRKKVRNELDQLGCNTKLIDRLILAVNEAAMNVIQHAYNNDENGRIVIEILYKDNDLIFRIIDFACTVDQRCIKSRDLDEVRPGGLGVHFMQEIMDDVNFHNDQRSAGNILIMRKHLDQTCLKKMG